MKVAMVAALVTSVAIADHCQLDAKQGKLKATCSIPSATTITSGCCSAIQNAIDKAEAHEQPTPQDHQEAMMQCQSFQNYMMQRVQSVGPAPRHPGPQTGLLPDYTVKIFNAMPDGLKCTESIEGDDESVCKLNAATGKLGVSCEIPSSTTITSDCCNTLQNTIDKKMTHEQPDQRDQQEFMMKCHSFVQWGQKNMHGPPMSLQGLSELPGGLNCMEIINGGDLMSLYANGTILPAISFAVTSRADVTDKVSTVPTAVSGIAGFLAGGMLVAGVYRYSKSQNANQQPLLTKEVV